MTPNTKNELTDWSHNSVEETSTKHNKNLKSKILEFINTTEEYEKGLIPSSWYLYN